MRKIFRLCSSVWEHATLSVWKYRFKSCGSYYPFQNGNLKRRKGNLIKLISHRDLHVLIQQKQVDATALHGVTVTSKTKNSRGKRYYAKDELAFYAWYSQGLDPDDKEYQSWKQIKERSKLKRRN